MASFSNDTKTEICNAVKSPEDRRAFLTGVLMAVRRFSLAELALQTECEAFAVLFPKLLKAAGLPPNVLDTEYRQRTGKLPLWCYTLEGKQEIAVLCETLQISPQRRAETLRRVLSPREQMLLSAGVFVMCGSITDPEREYHMELALPDAVFGVAFQEMLAALETPIPFKTTIRKNELLLYLKQNEQICDALVYFGAQNAAIEMINVQVKKDIRSQTNRRMNCDLANIDKAVAAGAQQVAEIEHIAATVGLDSLPEPLRQIAYVRLEEPEASLRELGAMLTPPISRSGVHHRLQKISEIAAKLP